MPNYRNLFVGLDTLVPLLDGSQKVYINLDNAASTPSFQAVQEQRGCVSCTITAASTAGWGLRARCLPMPMKRPAKP